MPAARSAETPGTSSAPAGNASPESTGSSEDPYRRGGQAHIATKTPQNEPVLDWSRIESESAMPPASVHETSTSLKPREPQTSDSVFARKKSSAGNALLSLLVGLGLLLFSLVGFAYALFTRLDQLTMHLVSTVPMILAVGALTAAWTFARGPRQVSVGSDGLRVFDRQGERRHRWDEMGWSAISLGALNQRQTLVIFDRRGKTLTKLSDALSDFDQLVELVQSRISRQSGQTSDNIQRKKSRRSAVFIFCTSSVFLILAGVVASDAYRSQRAGRLLEETGVLGEARIERRFLAPNGVTPRLEYRVVGTNGQSATRNAEVTRSYWDSLEGAEKVRILYLPDQPSISRLQSGEPESTDLTDNPWFVYGLSAVMSVVCLIMFTASIFQWYGWDIDVDSKTGKVSIKRFGTGR